MPASVILLAVPIAQAYTIAHGAEPCEAPTRVLAIPRRKGIAMRSLFVSALVSLLTASFAAGQVGGGGAIQGTVTDQTGAVLAGAAVTATNVDTGVDTNTKSTEAGLFVLSPLQPGEYNVT